MNSDINQASVCRGRDNTQNVKPVDQFLDKPTAIWKPYTAIGSSQLPEDGMLMAHFATTLQAVIN
jgi:hypothetical protein